MKRMKSVLSFAMAVMTMLSMAAFTFADGGATVTQGPVDTSISEGIQPRTSTGKQCFRVSGTELYLNLDNSSHPGTAQPGDTVIIWTYTSTNDQVWNLWFGAGGGYYFRSELNRDVALNINHVENKCTLQNPEGNTTQGKSDSDIYMNGSRLQLSQWGYQLSNTVLQAGYACYWRSNGTDYVNSFV